MFRNKYKIFLVTCSIIFSTLLVVPVFTSSVFAQNIRSQDESAESVARDGFVQCGNDLGPDSTSDCTFQDIFSTIGRAANFLIRMAGIIAVAMIVVGGFMMVLSAGDSGRLTTGKNFVKNAIFGLILVLVSFLIVNSLLLLLGVSDSGSIFSNPIQYVNDKAPAK